jgi:hypothetical protein
VSKKADYRHMQFSSGSFPGTMTARGGQAIREVLQAMADEGWVVDQMSTHALLSGGSTAQYCTVISSASTSARLESAAAPPNCRRASKLPACIETTPRTSPRPGEAHPVLFIGSMPAPLAMAAADWMTDLTCRTRWHLTVALQDVCGRASDD